MQNLQQQSYEAGTHWNTKFNVFIIVDLFSHQMSKTYKCTLNMEGHGKSKSAAKKKKVDEKEKKKEEETTAALKPKDGDQVDEEKEEGAEKKKKREDQSVRLFHDDTFKGLSL